MKLEKRKDFLINAAYFGLFAAGAVVLLKFLIPLAAPFVAAAIIAALLKGPIRLLNRKLYLPWKLSALLVTLVFYGVVGTVLSLSGVRVASALTALVGELPHLYESHLRPGFMLLLQDLEEILHHMDTSLVSVLDKLGAEFIQTVGKMISNLSVSAMGMASSFATALPGLFIKLVLLVISTFFIAMDYERLSAFCVHQLSDHGREVFYQIKEYVVGTLWVCIRSYLIIMSITFVELSISLTVIQVKHAVIIAFLIAVFDILPVLGTGGIMIPWSLFSLLQGEYSMALALILIYLIITVIRNIIEPKIVGGQLGLHPVVTLCSMFVGVQLLGAVGLFGFPIGLSLLCHLNKNGVIKVFR